MPRMPSNAGLNCPKCRTWILYKGRQTKCTKCKWRINAEQAAAVERKK